MLEKLLDNPNHWRAREEETRTLAELMHDPEAKQRLLNVADEYARLTEIAERRVKEKEGSR